MPPPLRYSRHQRASVTARSCRRAASCCWQARTSSARCRPIATALPGSTCWRPQTRSIWSPSCAPVTAIQRGHAAWQVTAGDRPFTAPVLVNAAGAWADPVARLAGVAPLGITPMRRSAALLPAPLGHDISRWPLFGSISETWYAKPDAGKLMVSPADEDPVAPHDAWPDDMVLAEGLHRYEQAVTVPVTRVDHSWAGLRSFTADRTPVAGFAPEADGFFWLAGQGGYGVQTAPALARLTAALVTGAEPGLSDATVAALSPARFHSS